MKNHQHDKAPPISDQEETEIQRQIAADPDDAELTDDQARHRMTFAEALPDLAESMKRSRGRPRVDNAKRPISLRLSPDVIDAFKATGKGWQTRIDDALREARPGTGIVKPPVKPANS